MWFLFDHFTAWLAAFDDATTHEETQWHPTNSQ